jgi:hypothetical protein
MARCSGNSVRPIPRSFRDERAICAQLYVGGLMLEGIFRAPGEDRNRSIPSGEETRIILGTGLLPAIPGPKLRQGYEIQSYNDCTAKV